MKTPLAASIPGAQLQVLSGNGHRLPLEQPDSLAA